MKVVFKNGFQLKIKDTEYPSFIMAHKKWIQDNKNSLCIIETDDIFNMAFNPSEIIYIGK